MFLIRILPVKSYFIASDNKKKKKIINPDDTVERAQNDIEFVNGGENRCNVTIAVSRGKFNYNPFFFFFNYLMKHVNVPDIRLDGGHNGNGERIKIVYAIRFRLERAKKINFYAANKDLSPPPTRVTRPPEWSSPTAGT